jgi:protein-L-isoaspartate(D-aspartate) O-methyltransferase
MPDTLAARRNMVDGQLRTNRVTDEAILAAMAEIPRELFVPRALASVAYLDDDLPLGDGRYLMEPMVLARLLQSAQIRPGDVVLDVGAATGYASAIAARLAKTVFALESDAGMARQAGETLIRLQIDNVVVVDGPLGEGYPAQAPYDVILIEGAVPEIPAAIASQLAEGGRICAVTAPPEGAGRAVLALRRGGVVSSLELFDAAVPPLRGFEKRIGFRF